MARTGLVALLVLAAAGLVCAEVTYSKEISRIIQVRCQTCHRTGDIAPFSLETYGDVVYRSRLIAPALENHIMPPWKPVAGFGEFTDARQMPDGERQMVLDWIANGMPEGDPADLPPAMQSSVEWPLGPPDLALSMLNAYTPPTGTDTYRCFIIPTELKETQMLSAIDVMPGARTIVHHVILFQDTEGSTEPLNFRDGQPGYPCFGGPGISISDNLVKALTLGLAGWAPGQRAQYLPDGIGIPLQKGARIIMQVHYSVHDSTDTDQTRIGLYFSKKPVTQRLFQVPVVNTTFTIPPGAEHHEVNASLPVLPLLDGKVIWVFPHMHLLGREITVDVLNRDQSLTPIIREDDWDFHWQGSYALREPLPIRSGSTVRLQCVFDNTEHNHHNPNDPPKAVSWGEATSDEMCLAFLGVTFDNERLLSFLLPGF